VYRWSLIAARLPGRTANDVKNYWHTNLRKKVIPRKEENEEKEKSKEGMIKSHEVIKPRPRTFSTHSLWLKKKHNLVSNGSATKLVISSEDGNVPRECDKTTLPNIGDAQPCVGNVPLSTMWWESLLNVDEERNNKKNGSCSLLQEENFTLEFSNVEDFLTNGSTASGSFWDFNLRDFNSFGVFN